MAVLASLKRSASPRALAGLWVRLACVVLFLAAASGVRAESAEAREYQLKAVFLYNFALFVDWPPGAFEGDQSPIVIGVLGSDPFGAYLDEVANNEKVNNRPLAIRRFHRVEDVSNCQILFVGISSPSQLAEVFSSLKGKSILTVGEAEDFSRLGGMIRFFTEHNKVRLRINLAAARSAGLKISSKLLRPAEIVSIRRTAP
jgi:hypothetical protein